MITLATIRKQLRSAAQREPQSVQPFVGILDAQIRNFAKGNAEDRAALKPQIDASIKRLEAKRGSDGR